MTPTEQDEELEKAVWASLASQMTHAINCTDPEHKRQDSCVDFTEKNFEQLMQLITADRKRVALEKEEMAFRYAIQTLQDTSKEFALENLQRQLDKNLAQQEEV